MIYYASMIGTIFGRLTVIKKDRVVKYGGKSPQTKIYWLCKCLCGNEKSVRAEHLRTGRTSSCGCWHDESSKLSNLKHGRTGSQVYRIWRGMKTRSEQGYLDSPSYMDVTRCKEWDSFEQFYKDMGEPPTTKHTLDRIDPFGNYEPSNCRWATRSEQALNLRKNAHLWEFYSSKKRPVSFSLFRTRLRSGWDIEKSASHPKMKNQFI